MLAVGNLSFWAGLSVETPLPLPVVWENVLQHLCIPWKSRARFPADTHKPYNLALEKKNGLEQENIFRAHYSSRSHREGARTEPGHEKQLTLQGQNEARAWHSDARQEGQQGRCQNGESGQGKVHAGAFSLSEPVLKPQCRAALLHVPSSPWLPEKGSRQ